jgi:hypothetical protein
VCLDDQDAATMSARGFALLEWLIASAFVLAIAGALFATVGPVRDTFARVQHSADLAASARAALDVIVADLREAPGDASIAPQGVAIPPVMATVELLQDLDTPVIAEPAAALSIRRVPLRAAQGRLRSEVLAGETLLRFEMTARCATGAPACGFRAGDHAVLVSDGNVELVTIEAPLADAVLVGEPLAHGFPADAVLCRVVTSIYGLRVVNGAAARLVRLTDGGAEQPLLDDVVAFEVTADSVNSAAMRRVSLRLRVEAAPDDLRGPAGVLFARAGTARSARRWLPDIELRADVALRKGGL